MYVFMLRTNIRRHLTLIIAHMFPRHLRLHVQILKKISPLCDSLRIGLYLKRVQYVRAHMPNGALSYLVTHWSSLVSIVYVGISTCSHISNYLRRFEALLFIAKTQQT